MSKKGRKELLTFKVDAWTHDTLTRIAKLAGCKVSTVCNVILAAQLIDMPHKRPRPPSSADQ